MRRMWRREIRRNKTNIDGETVISFGLRVGYWPCLKAPFLRFFWWKINGEVWYGQASLKQLESGDR
jgi:hypothetical protein